jgi:hypothetical protein
VDSRSLQWNSNSFRVSVSLGLCLSACLSLSGRDGWRGEGRQGFCLFSSLVLARDGMGKAGRREEEERKGKERKKKESEE